MALSATQKAQVRLYLGWSARFFQFDSRLEQAMSAVATEPEHELQITDTLVNNGLLASVSDILTKLTDSHKRLKATKVGSIDLPGFGEIQALRMEGKRHVKTLGSILGVEVRNDIFSSARSTSFASHGGMSGGGNYVGK